MYDVVELNPKTLKLGALQLLNCKMTSYSLAPGFIFLLYDNGEKIY